MDYKKIISDPTLTPNQKIASLLLEAADLVQSDIKDPVAETTDNDKILPDANGGEGAKVDNEEIKDLCDNDPKMVAEVTKLIECVSSETIDVDEEKLTQVVTLIESMITLGELGVTMTPLCESVDADYSEFRPLLEAVDEMNAAIKEAGEDVKDAVKEKSEGKLKAAVKKVIDYFYKIEPGKKFKLLPLLIRYIVFLTASLSAYWAGASVAMATISSTGIFAAIIALLVVVGLAIQDIDTKITVAVNKEDAEKNIALLEDAIAKMKKTKESIPVTDKKATKDADKVLNGLKAQLAMLEVVKARVDKKKQKEAIKDEKKAKKENGDETITESAFNFTW